VSADDVAQHVVQRVRVVECDYNCMAYVHRLHQLHSSLAYDLIDEEVTRGKGDEVVDWVWPTQYILRSSSFAFVVITAISSSYKTVHNSDPFTSSYVRLPVHSGDVHISTVQMFYFK